MAGLEIRYEVIRECAHSIRQLPACYPIVSRPPVSGDGKGIAEIEQLADLYASYYGVWEKLAEETAEYLISMLTDFKNADESKAVR